MTTLEEIKATIAEPLKTLDTRYKEKLSSPVPLVNEINDYLFARSGKQIRPMLVLLSAYMGNRSMTTAELEEKIQLGMAMEILHNSSLMHDDVVDESALRRGRESIRHRWSNKIAVLCGDYYLAMVMDILNNVDKTEISRVVDRTVIEMSEGELLQQQVSRSVDLDEDNYYSVIYKKTASLMATCCEIGCSRMRNFGEHFGMAFQIRDDIMDYHPDAETGKPQGNDIRERKMTLPLLCYLRRASKEEADVVVEMLKQENIDDEEADRLVDKVAQSGALDDAHRILEQRIEMAKDTLKDYADSPYKEALKKLADMLK